MFLKKHHHKKKKKKNPTPPPPPYMYLTLDAIANMPPLNLYNRINLFLLRKYQRRRERERETTSSPFLLLSFLYTKKYLSIMYNKI